MKKLSFIIICLFVIIKTNAQQIQLYDQFYGKYDYVAIGNTLNTVENNGTASPCVILDESSAELTLNPDQTIIAAYLYWAGSGNGDYDVKLNGTDITAERTFFLNVNAQYPMFGAFTDVTDIVQNTGNGTYTFSDINLSNAIIQHCQIGLNFGGWSIVVVYEDLSFINNLLNIYDGFEYVSSANTQLDIQLQGINVIDPQGGKLGFLAWEGDAGLAINETLRVNNNLISNPPLNPATNVFNGTNSFTGASNLYNMDLDFFDISNYVNAGDTTLDIRLTSGQDGVIVNNIVVVLSSELPDATIVMNPNVQGENSCGNRDLDIEFTVSNIEGTDILPSNIPIAFYADGVLVGQTQTNQSIAIGESTTQSISFTIPDTVPDNFELIVVVDDTGTVAGIQQEVSEDNNTHSLTITLYPALDQAEFTDQEGCSDTNQGVFDLNNSIVSVNPDYTVSYFTSEPNAENNTSSIINPENYSGSGIIYVRVSDPDTLCYVVYSFELVVNQRPALVTIQDYNICLETSDQTTVFDLISKENDILGGQVATVTYHTSQEDADDNTGAIVNPESYTNTSNPQTIFVRAEFYPNCYSTTSFELNVYQNPQIIQPSPYQLCDYNENGSEIFNLPSKANEIRNGQSGIQISFYNSESNASLGSPTINNTANYSSSGETIWVRAENINGCISITTLELVVVSLPVINQPTTYEVCSDSSDTAVFNLYSKNFEMAGEQPYTFSYYQSSANAQNEVSQITNPMNYTNTSNPQTIYVRIENEQGCHIVTQFDLLISPFPEAFPASDLVMCDNNSDGFSVFDLTQVNVEVTAGEPNTTVFFYETYEDLVHDANVIVNPEQYFNIAPYNQTIYIAVASTGGVCRAFTSVNLIVHDLPQITDATPLELCDDDYDGFVMFDLTVKADEVLGGLDAGGHQISYFVSEEDARNNTNEIMNPTGYTNLVVNEDSVWIRVDDLATGCYDVTELVLIVNPLPVVAMPNVEDYRLCDAEEDGYEIFDLQSRVELILNGQTGLTVTFYDTYEDAFDGVNSFDDNPAYDITAYQNQEQYVETVFVRVETQKGCFVVTLMDLITDSLPVLTIPSDPVVSCDGDGDGYGVVNLEEVIEEMLNGANPDDYVITFHETYTDAEFNLNIITDTEEYFNTDPFAQILYIRVATTLGSGCFNIYPITINVTVAPVLPVQMDGTLPELTVCDDNTDGLSHFDLTQQTTYILDAQSDITNLAVSYYESEQNAIDRVLAISNVTHYPNTSNPQTLWVVLEDTVTGCYDVASFELIINLPLEIPVLTPITVCDEDRDLEVIFDLTVRNSDILANATNTTLYTVEFFHTYQDALDGNMTNLITDPTAFSNMVLGGGGVYTIGVRVTDTLTGCQSYALLDIRRAPVPNVPTDPLEALVACDDNGNDDLQEEFDLTIYENYVRNGDTFVTITYHPTEEDAQNGTNEIATPEAYTTGTTTVYIRVANPPNGGVSCAVLLPLEIIVNPLPVVADNAFEICETNSTGYAEFYFPDFNPQMLGDTQDIADFTISYHHSQAAAQNNAAPISQNTPYTNQTQNSEIIWVRIVNNDTGCIRIAEITLYAEEGAVANTPTNPIFECDYDGVNDGITTTDLTQYESEILGTQNPGQFIVTYYFTEEDAHNATNEIPNPDSYTNTDYIGGQTIWIRVVNSATNAPCYDVTSMEYIVEPLAEPEIISELNTICVDWGSTMANNPIVLDSNVTQSGYTFQWYHNGDLIAGADQSTYTVDTIGQEGEYYVIAVSDNGCVSEPSNTFEVFLSGKASVVEIITDNAFADNQTITVIVQGNGQYLFQLDDGALQETGYFPNVSQGEHTVTVYDVSSGDINTINSCDPLVITNVQVVDYPRFFTPNGDGYNDYWNITGFTEFHNAEIHIFDRHGKLLKQLNPTGQGWDGTYNGNQLPSTDYWFKVIYTENNTRKEFKAHFAMKR